MCCEGDDTSNCGKFCLLVIAFLLPPLAVFLNRGCGEDFCINFLLTLLGWIPGVIHAMYIIITDRDKAAAAVSLPPATNTAENTKTTTTTTNTTTATTSAAAAPATVPAPATTTAHTPAPASSTTVAVTAAPSSTA